MLLSVVPPELLSQKKDSFIGSSLINDEDFVFPEGWCCVYENVLYKENEKDLVFPEGWCCVYENVLYKENDEDFFFPEGCIPRQPQKPEGWNPRKPI